MRAKTFFITINLIFSFYNLTSCQNAQNTQKDPFRDKIKKDAEVMCKYVIDKNYEAFIYFMYPPLIEKMGGKEKVLAIFNQGLSDGNTIENVKISYPSDTIVIKNQIQCTLKEELEMKVKGGKLFTTSTLIGISDDMGNTWHFIDTDSNSFERLKRDFPNLSSRLLIVKSSKPIYIKE